MPKCYVFPVSRLQPRQIEAFRAVMLAGSVNAAAAHLHVTQPAVSRLIRDLEAEIGFPLFERKRGRLVPRAAASQLFREVERVFVGLDHIARVAQDIHAISAGVIRIGTVSSMNDLCVKDVLPDVIKAYPRLSVIFDTESTERVLDLVNLRHYDFGLIIGFAERSGLDSELLGEGRAVLVMANEHHLAGRRKVRLREIVEDRVILPGRTSPVRLALEREARGGTLTVHNPIEASLSNCCHLAARGLGVAVVDPLVAKLSSEEVAVVPVEPAIPVAYRLVRPPATYSEGPLKAFSDRLREVVERRLSEAATDIAGM